MATTTLLADREVDELRRANYNAEVLDFIRIHEDLAILRICPDWKETHFSPGQYTVLGLGYWEPRVAGVQESYQRLYVMVISLVVSLQTSLGRRQSSTPGFSSTTTIPPVTTVLVR